MTRAVLNITGWTLAFLWMLPFLYGVWAAFHPSAYVTIFDLFAPLTLENLHRAWNAAPFDIYLLNSAILVAMVIAAQFVINTLAAYAFACLPFRGSNILFILVLLQLMIVPDVLLVKNYQTIANLGVLDTIFAMAVPYFASAFGIFLLRQAFKSVPKELEEAARLEGAGPIAVLRKVYVPAAKPIYLAYGLVTVSYHWNNFLWPLVVTNSVSTRPVTVGLQVFSTTEQGVDWTLLTAAMVIASAPLLIAFLIFQRQFVQGFMRAGIR